MDCKLYRVYSDYWHNNSYGDVTEEVQFILNHGYLHDAPFSDMDMVNGENTYYDYVDYMRAASEEHEEGNEPKLVFNWFMVNKFLGDALIEKGECVVKGPHHDYWGRTCCGQTVMMDKVIQDVFDSWGAREGAM